MPYIQTISKGNYPRLGKASETSRTLRKELATERIASGRPEGPKRTEQSET